MIEHNRIITFNLDNVHELIVKDLAIKMNMDILCTDCYIDIMAISASFIIINAELSNQDELDNLCCFYEDLGYVSQTIIWIGKPDPSLKIKKFIKLYDNFDDVKDKLKYLILSSNKKNHKNSEFSKSLSYVLIILSEIRKHPGITSKELAKKCELAPRSIQRYIETLRCCGEWIEYDNKNKGWFLLDGISILFADVHPQELE